MINELESHCDYFMGFSRAALNLLGTVTHSKHYGCILEEDLWLYSQRHIKNPIHSVNGHYVSYKRLPCVHADNISEFIPELDTEEKVRAAKLLLNSTFGMHGGLHIVTVPEEWKVKKEEAAKRNHAIIRGARSKVETFDDIVDDGKEEKDRFVLGEIKSIELNKEANNGKEENN